MNVGIIGARGFVGARLKTYLEVHGCTVTGYTRETVDLRNPSSFCRLGEHEVVINCAAEISCSSSELFAVNVEALHSLCCELNQRKVKPYLLQISSGAVYGYVDDAVDAYSAAAPVGDYALTKFLGDEIVRLLYQGEWAIARLYFPYGEGQSEERLLPRLIRRVITEESINVSSQSGGPMINPIYISDLCDKLYVMMGKKVTGICLLGGGQVISIAEIAQMIGRIAGADVKLRQVDGVSSNMFCHGNSKVLLEEGLARVFESLK